VELGATSGRLLFNVIQRHDDADVADFGNAQPLVIYCVGAANYISLFWTAANQLRLEFNDGGGAANATWNPSAVTVDTEYAMEILYSPVQMQLIVGNIVMATIVSGVDFTGDIPALAHIGQNAATAQHLDAVFIEP